MSSVAIDETIETGGPKRYWINAIANSETKWGVVDPTGPYPYGPADRIQPGDCLFIVSLGSGLMLNGNCLFETANAWCEKVFNHFNVTRI